MKGKGFVSWRAFAAFVALALAAGWDSRGYVLVYDAAGRALRWNLDAPATMLHTNVLNPGSRALRYFIGENGFSEANRTAELNAVRASFAQWQAIPETRIKFEEGGLVPAADVNSADNQNVVFWLRDTVLVNGGRDHISGATGKTFFDRFSDNTMAEADIVLNGLQFLWFTDITNSASAARFAEGVLVHEIGHLLGLAHSPVGGATMLARGASGLNTQAGLSPDEISAARTLYPKTPMSAPTSQLKGRITLNGNGVLGAVVAVEDMNGNMVAGTVSRTGGAYDMNHLTPGAYVVRVCPLDPPTDQALVTGGDILVTGRDILGYEGAETGFAPMSKRIDLAANQTTALDFAVAAGAPAFRISRIRPPTTAADRYPCVNTPIALRRGQSGVFTGVYVKTLPGPGAVLRVTGGGLSVGETTVVSDLDLCLLGLHLFGVSISVSPDAAPGLRSFVLEQGGQQVFANGFLEILPDYPDYNWDGLDDLFQRQYFPLFTAPEAGPGEDPDGDGFSNAEEDMAGSAPTDPNSVLEVESVRVDAKGSWVAWRSAPGRRYQVWSRSRFGGQDWVLLGAPVTSAGERTEYLDASSTDNNRFYRIQALPRSLGPGNPL